uniref:Uncharacterized protein n=1 Tax=Lates calcarifer TaxID=8187 RepID=A0A4W6G8E8_LATCA
MLREGEALNRFYTDPLCIYESSFSRFLVAVPPPTNVTLSCQNLKTTVSWEYNKHQPQTNSTFSTFFFFLNLDSINHQYDLSRFIWESTDRYKDIHSVTVIGVLNFPPVNLTVEDSRSTVSFQNPLLFYKELKQATKPDTYFDFSVSSDNVSRHICTVIKEPICRFDFSFPEGVEECVTLVGWLMTGQRTDWVAFNKTGRICHTDSTGKSEPGGTNVHWVILAVVLGCLVLVITAVTISVCCVKAWTTKPLPTPIVRVRCPIGKKNRTLIILLFSSLCNLSVSLFLSQRIGTHSPQM